MWSTSLSIDISGIYLRHRIACRTPAESVQEYLTSGIEYIEPSKIQSDEGTRGKKCKGTCPWLGGGALIPTSGQLSESEKKHLNI